MAFVLRLSPGRFLESYWRFRVAYDEADLDPVGYWHTVAQAASSSLLPAEIERLVQLDNESWTHPNRPVLDWARRGSPARTPAAAPSQTPPPPPANPPHPPPPPPRHYPPTL